MTRQRSVPTQELSDRELFDTAAHVLPNLRDVSATLECFGPNWKTKVARHNARMYEYDAFAASGLVERRPRALSSASALRFWPWSHLPSTRTHGSAVLFDYPSQILTSSALDATSSSAWPNAAIGVSYAAVVFCELSCHWTEAFGMLFSSDTRQFAASASAICGKKLRRCNQLRTGAFKLDARAASPLASDRVGHQDLRDLIDASQPGRIGVNAYELAPKHDLHLTGRHSRAQQLCFATYSQQAPAQNEATVVMRTLPKDVHDRLVEISEHSALRGALDHIAVGYHLTGHHSDATGHFTRLAMCAYVSTFAGNEVPEVMHWRAGLRDAGDRANSDAKHVVMLLARAACDFESVIQRRRMGLQAFLYAAPQRRRGPVEASCAVCEKDFGLLRRNQFCQLCGHHVCRRCSRKYEVESRDGGVRRRRVCHLCASRVGSGGCAPSPEGSKLAASTWYEKIEDAEDDCSDRYQCKPHRAFERTLTLPADALESPKPGHQLAEALFSPHPLDRARALEFLKKALQEVTQETPRDEDKPLDPALVGKYLEVRQRLTRMSNREFAAGEEDAGSGRAIPVFYQQQPLGNSSSTRAWSATDRHIFTVPPALESPTVDDDDDGDDGDSERDGLDAICEVAAQRLNCPMAFVSVLGRDEQHIVGAYEVPGCMYRLPRNQSIRSGGILADGNPVVARHPMRDPRLCHLPIVRDAGVRFFAGYPVTGRGGAVVASICVIDTLPRDDLSRDDHAAMAALAKLVADALDDSHESASLSFTPRGRC